MPPRHGQSQLISPVTGLKAPSWSASSESAAGSLAIGVGEGEDEDESDEEGRASEAVGGILSPVIEPRMDEWCSLCFWSLEAARDSRVGPADSSSDSGVA